MIKRLSAAMFIAMLTTSMAAVNSSDAQSGETPRVHAWSARKHVHHHRKKTVKHVNQRKAADAKGYKKVSSLVDFPNFFPGLGVIYVKPETLPGGPFLSFDRKDGLVATIYMIPVQDINDHKKFDLSGFSGEAIMSPSISTPVILEWPCPIIISSSGTCPKKARLALRSETDATRAPRRPA